MRARGGPGLVVLTAALVLAAPGVGADPPPGTEAPVETTTVTTTTVAATTTTTAETTTIATTTAPAETTTPEPTGATLAIASAPAAGCPPVGAVGLLLPHRRPLVLAPERQLTTAQVAYPADGSILTAAGLSLSSTCTDTRPAGGTAQVRGVSLFGGVVTAHSASVNLASGSGSVSGLSVNGRATTLVAGRTVRIGNWGYLIAPDPAAPSRSAFEIELATEHAGLPAGTLIFVPYARIDLAPPPQQVAPPSATTTGERASEPATTVDVNTQTTHDEGFGRPASKRIHFHKRKPHHRPLTITPPLRGGQYLFPVGGNAFFGDSYGGLRTDVSGGWHHGDDIFAPLGTPVVAVADGTLNRIGWERLGGWRLWVRDNAGDQFYYAHLSGYSLLALTSKRIHRGDVIGFVGNTGDAFTTLPHLHFEIHPRQTLRLHYDGAVNPTSYLQAWPRPGKLQAPRPVHPRLPRSAAWRHEATVNFRELLAARGLLRHASAPSVPLLPPVRAPDPMFVTEVAPRNGSSSSTLAWAAAAAGGACAAVAAGFAFWWRRRRPASV